MNRRNIFKTYEPVQDTPIIGVRGLKVKAEGRSDVNIYTLINGMLHTIHLHDVLYVPGNCNNLFSLGRWFAKRGDFSGRDLTLITKGGNTIANGTLMSNNLIKFHFCYIKNNMSDNYSLYTTSLSSTNRLVS